MCLLTVAQVSYARPAQTKEVSTFSVEGLAEYRARYNPVNGTHAAFKYGQAGAEPLMHTGSHKLSCGWNALVVGAVTQCMYDNSAKKKTINCGSGCQTYKGYGTGNFFPGQADECESNIPKSGNLSGN